MNFIYYSFYQLIYIFLVEIFKFEKFILYKFKQIIVRNKNLYGIYLIKINS